MKRKLLAGVVALIIIALIEIFLWNRFSKKDSFDQKKWDTEVQRLIKEGCITIQADSNGNTCTLNEKGDHFQYCTEMLTTIPWKLPKCVKYKGNA